MKKRIVALVCCLSLTVGLFSYQPPKAKALLTEASLATSVIWTFMQSAGLSFSGNNAGSQAWIDSCQRWYNKFMDTKDDVPNGFVGWLGYDSWGEFLKVLKFKRQMDSLGVPSTGYTIAIPKPIASKLAEFSQWFIGELGLTSGGESKPVVSTPGGYRLYLADGDFISLGSFSRITSRGLEVFTPGSVLFYVTDDMRKNYNDYKWDYKLSNGFTLHLSLINGPLKICLYASLSDADGVYLGGTVTSEAYNHYLFYGNSKVEKVGLAVSEDGNHITPVFFGALSYQPDDYKGVWYGQITRSPASEFTLSQLSLSSSPASDITVTQPGTYSPAVDTDGDKATVVTVPDLDGDIASINDLLQQILDKLAANDLTVSGSVEGADAPDVPATDVGWKGTIEKIYQGILSLPQAIADAIKAVLEKLFAPDAALMQEMTDTFKGKFSFLPTLHKVGTDLFGMTAETDPPVIWIHLEDAEGKYTYGGPVKALDLSWYQRYKADVDKLISGFLWLAFLWLLFKRAASIIHGGEMYTEYASDIRDYYRSGKKDDGPTVPTNRRLDK